MAYISGDAQVDTIGATLATPSGTSGQNFTSLVTTCLFYDNSGGGLPASYRRVSTAGGLSAQRDSSVIMILIDPTNVGFVGSCGPSHTQPLTNTQLNII